ncbi:MAG: tetratricopeptide repeat protein [Cyanobacteria bacterium P01_F01_bin.116]
MESLKNYSQTAAESDALPQALMEDCFSMAGVEGLKKCKDLVGRDKADSKVWNRLGRIFYDLESYQEAYWSFRYATHLQSDYALAWANTCATLSQLQSYEEALDACDQSLHSSSLSEDSVDEKVLALNNKATALYFLGRYREALDISDQVLVLKPGNSQAQINRAVTLHTLAHIAPFKHKGLT